MNVRISQLRYVLTDTAGVLENYVLSTKHLVVLNGQSLDYAR